MGHEDKTEDVNNTPIIRAKLRMGKKKTTTNDEEQSTTHHALFSMVISERTSAEASSSLFCSLSLSLSLCVCVCVCDIFFFLDFKQPDSDVLLWRGKRSVCDSYW